MEQGLKPNEASARNDATKVFRYVARQTAKHTSTQLKRAGLKVTTVSRKHGIP